MGQLGNAFAGLIDNENVGVGGQAQAQIANVIEPVAADLVPIAKELERVYKQIDLLEVIWF